MKRLIAAAVLASACGDPSPAPQYFYTCGDPVCRGFSPPPGVPRCTALQHEGSSCGAEGATCAPFDECNRRLVCAREDPTRGAGGCPISLAAYKKDVRYLDGDALRREHDALLALPLATWRYRWEPSDATPRLGFVIDDVGPAACVAADGTRVDLYGYTSMTVAAVQVQARELAALRAELAALRGEIARSGAVELEAGRRRARRYTPMP
jgi:hypothetical protein